MVLTIPREHEGDDEHFRPIRGGTCLKTTENLLITEREPDLLLRLAPDVGGQRFLGVAPPARERPMSGPWIGVPLGPLHYEHLGVCVASKENRHDPARVRVPCERNVRRQKAAAQLREHRADIRTTPKTVAPRQVLSGPRSSPRRCASTSTPTPDTPRIPSSIPSRSSRSRGRVGWTESRLRT